MLRTLNPQGSRLKPPEKLVQILFNIFFDWKTVKTMLYVHGKWIQLHVSYIHKRFPHPLFGKETQGSAGDKSVPLPLVFPNSCCLFFTYPVTTFLRGRPGHDHIERVQSFSGGVFYLPFGFIDQPLALDEMQHCDFDLAAGTPSPMKLDVLCPEFIPQGRSETEAEGLGSIVPPSAALSLVFVMGVTINGSVAVWRIIWEETSHSKKCSHTPPATQE